MQDTERRGGDPGQCWLWAQVQVRCGLSADGPSCLQNYLDLSAEVAGRAELRAFKVYLRVLRTLLLTAQDEALPCAWRSLCVAHAHVPLAQLASSIGVHDPIAMQAIEAAVQRAQDRLQRARATPRPGLSSR